jgi:transposase InsO family protein
MARKRSRPEEIVGKLRQADVLHSQGMSMADAIRHLGVSEVTYYGWRKEYGGLSGDQLRRLKDLEKENERLLPAVSDLTLDKQILSEAARENFQAPRAAANASTMVAAFSGSPSAGPAGVLGQHRATQRRVPRGQDDEDRLVADMIELARRYGRYGYRRIAALLRDAGWSDNDKRVERLWRREGLKVPARQPKRSRLRLNDGSCIRLRAEQVNHVWSYDFVQHRSHDGRAFRTLNVLDELTRESLAIRVRRKLSSADVIDLLTDLLILRSQPAFIGSDNGPELVAEAVQRWITAVGARAAFIEPGSPWENNHIESFDARLRDEPLDGEIFYSLTEGQAVIEARRRHYDTIRPHGSLGQRPPAPETIVPPRRLSGSLRSAGQPAWRRTCPCTNIQPGPVSGSRAFGSALTLCRAHRLGHLGFQHSCSAVRTPHKVAIRCDQRLELSRSSRTLLHGHEMLPRQGR